MAQDPLPKYKCLYDLYVDIRKAMNSTAPNPYPVPAPAPASPWMWIGIAGAGLLAVFAIVSLAKKK